MVADRKLSEAELFQVVGAGWKQHESEKRKKTFQEKLKGKPVFSMFLLFLIVLGCVFANVVANHDPSGFYLQNLNTPPGKEFIFGTDSLGRDIYSLIWYGGRVSLVIGLLGAAIITVIGVTYGCISGTAGPKVDSVLMRFTEMCGSIPTLLLILILSAVLQADDVISISVIIGITGWFALARHIKVMTRKTPGITITHQVFMISALFASESILPQETTSAGSPRPRKLNVDSMVIQLLIEEITTNMIAETKFGIRW